MPACPYCQEPIISPKGTSLVALHACQQCLNPCRVVWRGDQPVAEFLPETQDIRAYLPPESIGGVILSVLREAIDQMPVLPEIAQRAIQLAQDEKSSIQELSKLIEQDAVIAVKILKVANSALYGGLQHVSEIRTACTRLGMRTVINVLEAVASENLYRSSNPMFTDLIRQLWRHGVVTAYCAGEIARLVSEPRPDVLFVCGLIHDVGRLVLLDIISRRKAEASKLLLDSPNLLFELLDSFHAIVGLHVVQRWQMGTEFATVAYHHHRPDLAPDESLLKICHIVSLADEVAGLAGYGFGEKQPVSLVAHSSARFLSLSDIKIAGFRVDLEDRLASLFEALS